MESYSFENFAIALEEECILSNLNVNIAHESIVGIVGKKDSGKSLLMHALASEKTFASKVITMKNEPSYFPAALVKSNILIEENTAINNIRVLTAQNEDLMLADVQWYLEKVGLSVDDKRMVHSYTKAEKYLLAVAIVLSDHPKIIILDAPFKEFEIIESSILYALIQQLNRMNITIVITDRNAALLEPICRDVYRIQANSLEKISE